MGGGGDSLRRFVVALVAALPVLVTRAVRADWYPVCDVLPRSPVFLDRDVVTRCAMDEDGNGLDDELEQQLAECFVPEFRFDADEPAISLLPGEPVTGFSAYRIQGSNPAEVTIRFQFAMAWLFDGGFASDGSWLERWRFDAGATPVLVAKAALPAKARALSASLASTLVATDAGVILARQKQAGFELEGPLALCGRPLRIEELSETTWAVATTQGLAVVAGGGGSPLELRSMSLLVPGTPNVVALDAGPSALEPCKKAGAGLTDAAADGLAGVTALAHLGERLLVASGPTLYELTIADPDARSLRSVLDLPQPLQALRADPAALRAYGVAPSVEHPVSIDLRAGSPSLAGTHDFADWARRKDSQRLRVRVVANKAELARVAP